MNIVIPFAAVSHATVPSAGFNNNFTEVASKFNTYAVQTDVAKVISVAHTFSVAQNIAGLVLTGDVLFTDALYDIGKTGATRPRDGFFSRNVAIGGTLAVTGAITGSISGNAGTATALQTARAINGVNFDGTAPITVPAAAGTLTGAALAAGVTTSSLTTLGTLAAPLLFTDATYDIGAAGATRPRDGYFSGKITLGGPLIAGTSRLYAGSSTSVGVGATTIYSPTGGFGYVMVYGDDGAGKRYFDIVLFTGFTAPIVLSTNTLAGAPAARTYSAPGSVLQLLHASGTYTVKTIPFEAA